MNFEDKADQKISEDVSLLIEKLLPLDEKISVPSSIKPEYIELRRSKRTVWNLSLVAVILLLPFTVWTLINYKTDFKSKNIDKHISKLTTKSNSEMGTRYEDIKKLYLAIKSREALGSTNGVKYGSFIKQEVTGLGNNSMKDASSATLDSNSSGSVSDTNVQVEGVDEADIVKTNGDYIFTVASSQKMYYITDSNDTKFGDQVGSTIEITSTLRKGELKFTHSLVIEGYVSEMYVKNNLLIVLNRPRTTYLNMESNSVITEQEYYRKIQEINKKNSQEEYDKFYKNFKPIIKTSVLFYDISNPESPKLERTFSQDGDYQSSRLTEDHLYLVTNSRPDNMTYGEQVSDDINLEQIIPYTEDSLGNSQLKMVPEKCITIMPNPTSYGFVTVSGIDLTDSKETKTVACLGGGYNIYATIDSLYVMAPEYEEIDKNAGKVPSGIVPWGYPTKTSIKKFSLNKGEPKLLATGTIPGTILNQFSVDEFNGFFRMATNEVTVNSEKQDQTNSIYVLNGNLEVVGKINNMAPGEQIHSVRFMGEKGYVVTYKQVDPLFALDLKDPTNPIVTGKLKIPGFSEYLHPYSDDLLIGIGNDTTSNGYGGERRNGMKISMFDVSDPSNPKEVQSLPFGEKYSYSEILNNHKALLYSKEKDLIGFPVQTNGKNEFYVFKIIKDKGFELIGKMSQKPTDLEKRKSRYKYGSMNKYTSMIQRGILIDDVLYTVSAENVKASSIQDFQPISQVDFPE